MNIKDMLRDLKSCGFEDKNLLDKYLGIMCGKFPNEESPSDAKRGGYEINLKPSGAPEVGWFRASWPRTRNFLFFDVMKIVSRGGNIGCISMRWGDKLGLIHMPDGPCSNIWGGYQAGFYTTQKGGKKVSIKYVGESRDAFVWP